MFGRLYDNAVLRRPRWALAVLLLLVAVSAYWARSFRLDASTDSLVLEHDDDLRFFRKISDRYATGEFVVITYTPREDLFSPESLNRLRSLRDELRRLPRIASVVTILDAPLLKNPPAPLEELRSNIKSLETPGADLGLAIAEMRDSPIYRDLLASSNMRSTAVLVNFKADNGDSEWQARRSALRLKVFENSELSQGEKEELAGLENRHALYKERVRLERKEDIAAIRSVIDSYRSGARMYLGGLPMVVDDIITFIKKDLRVFSFGMLIFLILTLGVIFRKVRWVAIPMLCCAFSVVVMMGFLGLIGWEVTVVSSNFISLQLIFTMSLAIHLVVRYQEILKEKPQASSFDLIRETIYDKFTPCLYATLTTIAGFASLVVSDILPVMNFGWMMSLGLGVTVLVTFVFFPAALMLLPKPRPSSEKDFAYPVTSYFARLTERRRGVIYAGSLIVAAGTVAGIMRLEVENSFINYFRKSTEIYQGMKFIDQELGGTTPLDITLNFQEDAVPVKEKPAAVDEDFSEFEEFEEKADPSKYWYTSSKLETIRRVHDYLESLPSSGKVLSLATLWKTANDINGGKPLDDFTLALLFNQIPEEFKKILVHPYASVDSNQARVNLRIKDSMKSLRRDALLKQIQKDLKEKLGLREDEFRLTGIMVLYNNMLQSLFDSQIRTIGYTLGALMLMFLILFRSVKISLIAIFPNLLSALVVLGVMGLGGIPLDLMTITIVAISVGIAVDDTIHYLHRFEEEFKKDGDYLESMRRCHSSIGNAMFYTSATIIIGFSILAFSNFIPSILFGLLTALAMAAAIVAALSLLPALILTFKPYGPGRMAGRPRVPEPAPIFR